jgi:hypothetical protein
MSCRQSKPMLLDSPDGSAPEACSPQAWDKRNSPRCSRRRGTRVGGGGLMTNGKDSPEIIKFLALYTRLKDWCDDNPDTLFQLAIAD